MSATHTTPSARIHLVTGVLALVLVMGCEANAQRQTTSLSDRSPTSQPSPASIPTASVSSRAPSPAPGGTPSALPSHRGGSEQQDAPGWHFWSERFNGDVTSVTEWAGRLIAVGTEGQTNGVAQNRPINSRIWKSSDASEWTRMELPGDVGRSGFAAVYASATGELVVLGKYGSWTSSDAESWTAIDVPEVSDPMVAVGSSGFLMTDRAPEHSPLWESEDGIEWRPIELPGIEEGPRIVSLAVGDTGRLVSACKLQGETGRPAASCRMRPHPVGSTHPPTAPPGTQRNGCQLWFTSRG